MATENSVVSKMASAEFATGFRTKSILLHSFSRFLTRIRDCHHAIFPPDLDEKYRLRDTSVRDIVSLRRVAGVLGLTALALSIQSPLLVTQQHTGSDRDRKRYRKTTQWERELTGQMKPVHGGGYISHARRLR